MTIARLFRNRCPVCDSEIRTSFMMVRRKNAFWHLAQCECKFVYVTDPRLNTFDPAAHTGPRPRHFQIKRLLDDLLPEGGSVIEIGAGGGALARLLHQTFQYFGYEPGGGTPELNVHAAEFDPAQVLSPVDALILDNVLEHIVDPRKMLADAASVLRSKGFLILVVPNRHDIRRFHPAWRRSRHWIPPDHINYFSRKDLNDLLEMAGLERAIPFGMRALKWPEDWRYLPRALVERFGLSLFGHNLYARRK